jgi:hypothetical protein
MLDEFHQQLAQATHQAAVEDLRRQLNNATLERDQFALDIERLKDENQRLQQELDACSRINTSSEAEPHGEERQLEPRDMRSEEAESSRGASSGCPEFIQKRNARCPTVALLLVVFIGGLCEL